MYFNVNFNVFFKLIKVHLLVSELYILHTYVNMYVDCTNVSDIQSEFTHCAEGRNSWDIW